MVQAKEEPDAVSRYLGHIERAGSCVLQCIAPLRAAQAQPDRATARRPYRYLETAVSGDRRGCAGACLLAGGEGLVDAALDCGREHWRRLHPVGVHAPINDEA